MRRLLGVLVLTGGFTFAGITSANAAYYCNVDPNIPLGTPLNYSIDTRLYVGPASLWTENSGSSYQHFAAGFGL